MRQTCATALVVICTLAIIAGLILDLNPQSQLGLPLLLGSAVVLLGVFTWHSFQLRNATLIGFLVGAAVPVAYGCYGIAHEVAYRSSHPGEGFCGIGMLGAMLSLIVGAPVCGGIGATVVATASAICGVVTRSPTASDPFP